jgi:hypothetical protein
VYDNILKLRSELLDSMFSFDGDKDVTRIEGRILGLLKSLLENTVDFHFPSQLLISKRSPDRVRSDHQFSFSFSFADELRKSPLDDGETSYFVLFYISKKSSGFSDLAKLLGDVDLGDFVLMCKKTKFGWVFPNTCISFLDGTPRYREVTLLSRYHYLSSVSSEPQVFNSSQIKIQKDMFNIYAHFDSEFLNGKSSLFSSKGSLTTYKSLLLPDTWVDQYEVVSQRRYNYAITNHKSMVLYCE